MYSRIRQRITFANVTALLALFMALGGGSYAVAQSGLDSGDVRNNSLHGRDIRNSSLTSSDIRNGSLRARDFRRGQLRRGDRKSVV